MICHLTSMLTQAHLYIKGDVIGIGFRAWAKIQAKMNQVTGWVRNVYEKPDVFGPSGGVEAVFQGEKENVERMVDLMRQGSPISHIEEVEVFVQEPTETFGSFEIRK